MEIVKIMFTKGDHATQPGGVILRKQDDGGFVTHRFNRIPHTRTPREFFWGHYFSGPDAEERAIIDYEARVRMVENFAISEGELIAKGDGE